MDPRNMSVKQLAKLVSKKKTTLDALASRRARLMAQLDDVQDQIDRVVGKGKNHQPRKIQKRPRNGQTLLQVIMEVLAKRKRGMTLAALTQAALAKGYKTGAAKFENTVYQCLYHSDRIARDPKSRRYVLQAS